MNRMYFIKYDKMFLKSIYVDENSVLNNFINEVNFKYSVDYCDSYSEEIADSIITKLSEIGFNREKLYKKVDDRDE